MAENAHSTPASKQAEETCANILADLVVSFLIALSIYGLQSPDPVTTGHAYAVEAVR
ncbi:hypothetical protein AA0242T_2308 [Acetobacter aceti NRIC 0242]|uniref:Uncharacterized protein n=1 Tax=Acetobacter aceti NBRC 14818 TaxID=887700 RepID=A0AB33IFA9_ACEAC|nr:hypothetical protein [Acetobacter aceti]TCS33047.1 hypothetical protein EDC15_109119 [Acetobacter aceti NBRC 14818]BCK76481.1 hypothetical protein EMQ_2087 [Acetobacter aceti NBRC 14818]GAN56221.1 hypothetical protein Abac_003_120 [Acetobacter aceti NBRC 14818]GBO81606.1 hypothetical protein AA0242T_2308 [Acetobacter aceti NRIC 0242]